LIRIIDTSGSYSDTGLGSLSAILLNRKVYQRLQRVVYSPLGSESDDSIPPISVFISEFEKFYSAPPTNTAVSNEINSFLGSLGVSIYYPHPDNTYKGELA